MPRPPKSIPQLKQSNVAAYRLEKHHLLNPSNLSPKQISSDVSGIQAQLMTAADLSFWARNHNLTRKEIRAELAKGRTLVKTSLMRQTLHIIPVTEFSLFINAIKRSRMASVLRIAAQCGVSDAEVHAHNARIIEALSKGPLTIQEIVKRVEPKAGKNLKFWMGKVWNPLRTAVVSGLICYGPETENRITFVRSEHWLPKQPKLTELEAQQLLLFKFLTAYGPSTPRDFGKWSGISMKDVKTVWDSWRDHLVEVNVEGAQAWSLKEHLASLKDAGISKPTLRLLGAFDTFLLAHHEKDHLIPKHHYKTVYRNQGWISAVVLLNGRIAGVWSHKQKGKSISVSVNLHENLSKPLRHQLEEEVDQLGAFLGVPTHLTVTQ